MCINGTFIVDSDLIHLIRQGSSHTIAYRVIDDYFKPIVAKATLS